MLKLTVLSHTVTFFVTSTVLRLKEEKEQKEIRGRETQTFDLLSKKKSSQEHERASHGLEQIIVHGSMFQLCLTFVTVW